MPFRKKLLHVFPKEDLSDVDYYLSRSQLPGMLPLGELGLRLYGYPLRPLKQQVEGFATRGGTDWIAVGVGTGGCIQEWIPRNGPQLFNHAGWCGRSMNQTFFVTGKGHHLNPTMAGDKYDAFFPEHVDPKIPAPPLNYSQHTLLHGSRMLQMERNGNKLITEGIPLEWDPDGVWMGENHGGNSLDAVEYPDLRFKFEIDVHWKKPGLHRIKSIAQLPQIDRDLNLKWGSLGLFLRFGYDDITSYNEESGTFTDILDSEMCSALSTTVEVWEDKGKYVLGTLAQPHGRLAETRQNVIYPMPLPDDPDNTVKISSIFMDGPESARLRIDPKPENLPKLGLIFAPAAYRGQLSDVQMRYGFQDRIAIGGGTGLFNDTDQAGSYPTSPFGSKGNGIIYTSRGGSSNPWSFNQDFAVGLFLPSIDNRSGASDTKSQRHIRWASKRGAATPTNGAMDTPVMILADTHGWNAGLWRPSGVIESTAYLCTGNMAEVRGMMEYLSEIEG